MPIFRKAAQWLLEALNLQDRQIFQVWSTGTYTGRSVTPYGSMQSAAVLSCVKLLSETVASLPIDLMQKKPGGIREEILDHPLVTVLDDEPNPEMSSMDFRMAMMVSATLWGNAYARKIRRGSGRNAPVIGLWPLFPDRMLIKRDPDTGELIYRYQRLDGGPPEDFPAKDIFHLRTLSYDGRYGLSPITLHREGIALGLAAEEFAGRFFGNGAKPGIMLQYPEKLGPEAIKNIRESFEKAHQGLENAHRVGILEQGMTVVPISMPLKDAEFLDTRKFQRAEIASIYRVPPHMIGDVDRSTSWGTGIEQQSIGFVQYTLLPWLTIWEKAIKRSLLTDEDKANHIYVKHNVSGLLRGDIKARYDAYQTGIRNRIINPNEARAFEDMNPYEGGSTFWAPLNEAPIQPGVPFGERPTAPTGVQ